MNIQLDNFTLWMHEEKKKKLLIRFLKKIFDKILEFGKCFYFIIKVKNKLKRFLLYHTI